jgi:hypothetical protein
MSAAEGREGGCRPGHLRSMQVKEELKRNTELPGLGRENYWVLHEG